MVTTPKGLRMKTAKPHNALLFRTIPCRRSQILYYGHKMYYYSQSSVFILSYIPLHVTLSFLLADSTVPTTTVLKGLGL
jgi:hypothetical protein